MTSEVEGLDLDALEKVARSAGCGGPWMVGSKPHIVAQALGPDVFHALAPTFMPSGMPKGESKARAAANATFVATFDPPTVLRLLTALRAQAERVRVLEGENADTLVRWCARMAEIREASGVGVKPMLDEVPGAIAERIAAAEARAEAAERRAGEAEARVIAEMQYANASRNIAARLHGALAEIARGDVPPEKEGHYRAHREAVRIARAALLPATQAEGEK